MSGYYCSKALVEGVSLIAILLSSLLIIAPLVMGAVRPIFQEGLGIPPHDGSLRGEQVIYVAIKQAALSRYYQTDCAS